MHTRKTLTLSLKVVTTTGPAAGQYDYLLSRFTRLDQKTTQREVTGDSRASTQCYFLTHLGNARPQAKKRNLRQQWDVCSNQLSCNLLTWVWAQVLTISNTSWHLPTLTHTPTHNTNKAVRETGTQLFNPSAWEAEAGGPTVCQGQPVLHSEKLPQNK